MEKRFSQGLIIFFTLLLSISFVNVQYIYAVELREEAESYRKSGYEAQERGDIDSAIIWYQKAAILDSNYSAPHNDLGILFEAKGWLDRAESEYQKTLAIDPDYEKAHTNLALLYERKGEMEKAAFHWMRRYRLGRRGDPWTEQARQRLEKLGLLDKTEKRPEIVTRRRRRPKREKIEERPKEEAQKEWLGEERYRKRQLKMQQREEEKEKRLERKKQKEEERKKKWLERKRKKKSKSKEWSRLDFKDTKKSKKIAKNLKSSKKDLDKELQESLRLAEKRLREQKAKKKSPKKESLRQRKTSPGARSYYLKAENYYKKGEYARALDTIRTAKKDYPGDSTLLELEQSIKNKMKEERIEDHYNEGIIRYHQKDFLGARKEFEAILNILPE